MGVYFDFELFNKSSIYDKWGPAKQTDLTAKTVEVRIV